MTEKRRKFTAELREGAAVRIVTETGKPAPEVSEDLGINETTLASRVSRAKRGREGHAGGQGRVDRSADGGERGRRGRGDQRQQDRARHPAHRLVALRA
ncbi:transposase [Streptomyces sp. c-19]|uniref:transposase n=1 Tax=Streptomyces sp. c-19 TaxID=2789275 RepID=UPI0039804014